MHTIRIDTSPLTYARLRVPGATGHLVDGSVRGGAAVTLAAGRHTVEQSQRPGTALPFEVTEDGFVDYPASLDGVLAGRGSRTLRVVGVDVTVRPTGRARPLLPLWGGCREPIGARVRTLRMPPGEAWALRLLQRPSTLLEFHVGADGRVDYPAACERALSGRGTGVLTVDLDALAH